MHMNSKIRLAVLATASLLMFATCQRTRKNVVSVINKNETVQEYSDRSVKEKDVKIILESGMSAPCARDVTPWQFMVIAPDKIQKLHDDPAFAGNVRGAKAAIIVCGLSRRFGEGDARLLWVEDCAAATQNMILTARAMSMTPQWIRLYPFETRMKRIVSLLDLDPGVKPFSLITLGYAERTEAMKSQQKEDDVVWLGSFE